MALVTSDSDKTSNLVKTPVLTTTSKPSNPVNGPDKSVEGSVTPRHPDPTMKFGYLGIHDRPEEIKPSMIYGKIDGRIAQIILDNDYSTYVLSTDFANTSNVPCFPCKPIPVELAVRNASQYTLNTQIKKLPMEVGTIIQSKTSYVLPLSNCDAIFGMSFLNDRKLITYLEKDIITLDDMKLLLVKDHDELPYISSISRSRLKAEIRKNEITKLYLATAKITNESDNITNPDWITNEFSDIFLDGLSPGMPPERKAVHEIPLHPDSSP